MSGIYGEEYGETIIPGELGSTNTTAAADNSGNTVANVGGLTEHVFDPTYGGTLSNTNANNIYSGLKQLVTDNKGWLAAAGALGSVYGGGSTADKKTGYQGTIPLLSASRSMIAAPPTRAQGYRPGAGGIDYGGDVTYKLAPGQDPWANLSGTSASSANANLTTVPTNISNIVTNTGGTDTKVTNTGLTAEQQAIENWRKSLTPQQYLSSINQWVIDHPNVTKKELDDAMAKFKVTQTDLQTALGSSNMSAADKYALTHGQGLADINQNIVKWIQDHPYATKTEIDAAIKGSGVNLANIDRALTDKNASKGLESALLQGMGLDQYYTNINKFIEDQKRDTTTPNYLEEFSRAAAKQAAGVSDADIAAAEKFLATDAGKKALEQAYTPQLPKDISGMTESDIFKLYDAQRDAGFTDAQLREAANKTYGQMSDTDWNYIKSQAGYAQGGMAKGRYLQGETDGMADELPAQIGQDQPAALSHGEFVVPADVVSHLGNGNSDAGAKKLYQMMDKIRMARTGTKKQGKEINPDKFMPGGLAKAYAEGGKVKGYAAGGTTTTPTNIGAAANAGVQGSEANLSNWAGPYATNFLAQGQALANMPYQAYMGPLTAGPSALQNKVSQGLEGINFPGILGQSFTSAGAPTAGADGQPVGGGGIAASYMNPYLQNVLNPQMDELRRQSQINLQPGLAKLTSAGGYGGGRQAIMESEANRNLLQEQNKTVGLAGLEPFELVAAYRPAFDVAFVQRTVERHQLA